MAIESIQQPFAPFEAFTNPNVEEPGKQSFFSSLNETVQQANELLLNADKKSVELSSGKTENIHEAMVAFEKAEAALKLLTQVRSRVIEAYHEVMKMQI